MIAVRSYCGESVLENIRVRVTLKKPPIETAIQETETRKNENTYKKPGSCMQQECENVEVSYTVVCRLLPHIWSDKAVSHSGEHLILKDRQVRRLCRGNTVFQYEVEIFEQVTADHRRILTCSGFPLKSSS